MNNNYIFTAELVAFAEKRNLPRSLYPFIRPSNQKEMMGNGKQARLRDVRLAVFKIRETIDSYHTIIVKKGMSIEEIEDKLQKDLEVVILSDETRNKLNELLEKFRHGKFSFFLNHHVNKAIYTDTK